MQVRVLSRQFPRRSDRSSPKPADGSRIARVRTTVSLLAAVAIASVLVGAGLATGGHRGPLAGTWSGSLTGGSAGRGARIVIVVNARETGGSWQLSATCRGPLALDSISGGYHHYLRKLAPGATCAGGDIDCLKLAGASLYDSVTSHLGGTYDVSGTLRRLVPHRSSARA